MRYYGSTDEAYQFLYKMKFNLSLLELFFVVS